MKLCNKCGCTMQDTDQVCGVCGASLVGNSTPVAGPVLPTTNNVVEQASQPVMIETNVVGQTSSGLETPQVPEDFHQLEPTNTVMNTGVNQGAFQPNDLSHMMTPPEQAVPAPVQAPVETVPQPVPAANQTTSNNKKPFIIIVAILAVAIILVGISVATKLGSKEETSTTTKKPKTNPNHIVYADHEFDFPKNYTVKYNYADDTLKLFDYDNQVQMDLWVILNTIDEVEQAYRQFPLPFTIGELPISSITTKEVSNTSWLSLNGNIQYNEKNIQFRNLFATLDDNSSVEALFFDYKGGNIQQAMDDLTKVFENSKTTNSYDLDTYKTKVKKLDVNATKKIEIDEEFFQAISNEEEA